MGSLDTALDTLFASELAVDATYSPLSGSPFQVRAMLRAPDVEVNLLHGAKVQQQSTIFEIRKSELPNPNVGEAIQVGDVAYRVMSSQSLDPRRAFWTLEAGIR